MPQLSNLKVEDSIEINSSPHEIFSYFTDAEKISGWWSKSAVCTPKEKGKLTFIWENNTALETFFKTYIAKNPRKTPNYPLEHTPHTTYYLPIYLL